jgi:hypothetical protein
MAALFYTNHCSHDVYSAFTGWREAFTKAKQQKKKVKVPAIDTSLVA